MIRERVLTISLLLPLMATSGVAYASHNYQHRPNEIYEHRSALAMEKTVPHRQVAPASRSCTYQGWTENQLMGMPMTCFSRR